VQSDRKETTLPEWLRAIGHYSFAIGSFAVVLVGAFVLVWWIKS